MAVEKDTLLADLCARLPYGVKVDYHNQVYDLLGIDIDGMSASIIKVGELPSIVSILNCKPYLRTISSMTDIEREEFELLTNFKTWSDDFDNQFDAMWQEYGYVDRECVIKTISWFNKYHFDYRGLIKEGSAHEAPKGWYNS